MPITVFCPNCESKLNAPDASAGKTVKCPKCKEPMVLPDAEDEDAEEETPRKKSRADDDDDRPVKKKRAAVDDDDDEDERPRKKKKGRRKPAKAGPSPVLIGAIAAGILVLAGGGFAAYWFGIREKPKETAGGDSKTNSNPNAPGPGGTPSPGTPLYDANNPLVKTYMQDGIQKMRQMGRAFHMAADAYGGIPVCLADSTGKPGLSWRVAMLPFIEQDALYRQFKLNEPWDSEHNKKLIPLMPKIFAAPGQDSTSGKTHYRGFSGPDATFHAKRSAAAGQILLGRRLHEFQDGTSNTVLVAEALLPVEWTKPDELEYSANGPVPKVGGVFASGSYMLFADGAVRMMRAKAPEKTLRALITPGGGEIADIDD